MRKEEFEDYYETLKVPVTASAKDISSGYKKLALKYHPDKNQDIDPHVAAARFHKIQKAYSVLADPQKRHSFDKVLYAKKSQALRVQQMDATRRHKKQILETKEREAAEAASRELRAKTEFSEEITRIRRERTQELDKLKRKKINNNNNNNKNNNNNNNNNEDEGFMVKVSWRRRAGRKRNAMKEIGKEEIVRKLEVYGDINKELTIIGKKGGVVCFKTFQGAAAAIVAGKENGRLADDQFKFKLMWVKGQPRASTTEPLYKKRKINEQKSSENSIPLSQASNQQQNNNNNINNAIPIFDVDDFEAQVLMRMKRAQDIRKNTLNNNTLNNNMNNNMTSNNNKEEEEDVGL